MSKDAKLKDTSKIKELLSKLEAMAERGESGERDVARRKIDEISKKYGLEKSLWKNKTSEPKKEAPKDKEFFCKSKEHKDLLVHCIFDTKPDAKVFDNGAVDLGLLADINDLEYIEVTEKMKHYWNAYVRERSFLLKAFIVKHHIGTRDVNERESSAISKSEYNLIQKRASTITKKPFKSKP